MNLPSKYYKLKSFNGELSAPLPLGRRTKQYFRQFLYKEKQFPKVFLMKTILFLLFANIVFPQPFQIIGDYNGRYTIDKIEQAIYYQDRFTKDIFKALPATMEFTKVDIPGIPYFANNSRLAVIPIQLSAFGYELLLKDFDSGKEKIILAEDRGLDDALVVSFSPNNTKILFSHQIYSFTDSSFKNITYEENDLYFIDKADWRKRPVWSSENTILFTGVMTGDDKNTLKEYNLTTGIIDTILGTEEGINDLTGFDFHIGNQILAYATTWSYPEIHFLDRKTGADKIVVNLCEDFSDWCCGTPVAFEDLKWSDNGDKLTVFSVQAFLAATGISVYYPYWDSLRQYTVCDEFPGKGDVAWLNRDTIIYGYTTRQVWGFDITSPLTTISEDENRVPKSLSVSNYPNPFNDATNIALTVPFGGNVTISIYNQIGELIDKLQKDNLLQGEFNFLWNADNLNLPSGIYFLEAILLKSNKVKNSKYHKIVYLK